MILYIIMFYSISRFFKNYAFLYMKKYMFLSLLIILFGYRFWNVSYKFKITMIFGILMLFCILFFYRIPKLNPIKSDKFLFSPCFGKVADIKKTKDDMLQIIIYIRMKDPHVQYVPYNGLIKHQLYKKGTFHPAHLFEKSQHNEKIIHNIQTSKGLITVVQIGGIITRSIKSFVKKGQNVTQNQELGNIGITGSRVDVFVPLDNQLKILVEKGDKVTNKTKLLEFEYF
jgi:phosphatidylserine decarboxylase